MIISVNFSDDELKIIKYFAKVHNMTITEYIRQAVLERIKNEQQGK